MRAAAPQTCWAVLLVFVGNCCAQTPPSDVLSYYDIVVGDSTTCAQVDEQAAWLLTAVEFLECPQGWEGVTCSREVDECEGLPCKNGATCTDMLAAFSCTCAPGWTGDTCEQKTVIRTLAETVFEYWSTGDSLGEGESCDTLNSFLSIVHSDLMNDGGDSELLSCSVNECDSMPCFNNGTCFDGDFSYICDCPDGFSGQDCEENDWCFSMPCENNAVCTSDSGSGYGCDCAAGFSGQNCALDYDECASAPCLNGATCADSTSDVAIGYSVYVCSCSSGFAGANCQIDIDECASAPCLNGAACVAPDLGQFECICLPGYQSLQCSVDIDECASNPCENGALCSDSNDDGGPPVNTYTCSCLTGFQSTPGNEDCAVDTNECAMSPCQHGSVCAESSSDTTVAFGQFTPERSKRKQR
jgi:hypothetical protein